MVSQWQKCLSVIMQKVDFPNQKCHFLNGSKAEQREKETSVTISPHTPLCSIHLYRLGGGVKVMEVEPASFKCDWA